MDEPRETRQARDATLDTIGGGVQGGRVVGALDEIGAYPKDRPVTPAEVLATIYHAPGIPLEHELPGPPGRPIPVVDYGRSRS